MTNILVVGGAGYIGSHTCLDLSNKGFTPIVYDNLSNGHAEFVHMGRAGGRRHPRPRRLDEVLRRHQPAAIVHFAALIEVGQSVEGPACLLRDQCRGNAEPARRRRGRRHRQARVLLDLRHLWRARRHSDGRDASAAADQSVWTSKLIVERMLADLDRYKGFRSVVLRYFNAAGADPEGRIGEWHSPETHLIPLAIEAALGRRAGFKVFGADYDTRDGTCVRDFVHVMDLADAHSRAVQYLLDGGESVALNLGTGDGTTVKELLTAIENCVRQAVSGGICRAPRRRFAGAGRRQRQGQIRARLGAVARSRFDHRDRLELAFATRTSDRIPQGLLRTGKRTHGTDPLSNEKPRARPRDRRRPAAAAASVVWPTSAARWSGA